MFEYVEDKEYLSRVRSVCGEIMQDFCHTLKEDYDIGSTFYLVGSGAKNLIVQNASQPIDLDYNLEIVRCEYFGDCRKLKECARKAFNKALSMNGWGDCEDSTSSLTTERRHFTQGQSDFIFNRCLHCVYGYTRPNVSTDPRKNVVQLLRQILLESSAEFFGNTGKG